LYANPPEDGVLLCFDEFGPVGLNPHPGNCWAEKKHPVRLPATYTRKGTRQLLSAKDKATYKVLGKTYERKTNAEVIDFFNQVKEHYKGKKLYIILDNASAHKHKNVVKWVADQNGQVELIFQPTYSAWLNHIEPFFGNLKKFAIKGSNYQTFEEMEEAMLDYIARHNEVCDERFLKALA
jgi:transposase